MWCPIVRRCASPLLGDVVAHCYVRRCGSPLEGDVVAHWKEMWWPIVRRCGGTFLKRCGGPLLGDGVAHDEDPSRSIGSRIHNHNVVL